MDAVPAPVSVSVAAMMPVVAARIFIVHATGGGARLLLDWRVPVVAAKPLFTIVVPVMNALTSTTPRTATPAALTSLRLIEMTCEPASATKAVVASMVRR
jgi:hypothetical protein